MNTDFAPQKRIQCSSSSISCLVLCGTDILLHCCSRLTKHLLSVGLVSLSRNPTGPSIDVSALWEENFSFILNKGVITSTYPTKQHPLLMIGFKEAVDYILKADPLNMEGIDLPLSELKLLQQVVHQDSKRNL